MVQDSVFCFSMAEKLNIFGLVEVYHRSHSALFLLDYTADANNWKVEHSQLFATVPH